MKITAKQKKSNLESLVQSLLDLCKERDYGDITMNNIADRAGLSRPVIYKYFRNKDSIALMYFELSFEKALRNISKIQEYETLRLDEQIQILIETHLSILKAHKNFLINLSSYISENNIFRISKDLEGWKEIFLEFIKEIIDASIDREEIPSPPFKDLISNLFWDYFLAIILYWIKDESKNEHKTHELIDKSISLIYEILKQDLINKAYDLAYFFIKEHFLKSFFTPHKKILKSSTKNNILKRFRDE